MIAARGTRLAVEVRSDGADLRNEVDKSDQHQQARDGRLRRSDADRRRLRPRHRRVQPPSQAAAAAVALAALRVRVWSIERQMLCGDWDDMTVSSCEACNTLLSVRVARYFRQKVTVNSRKVAQSIAQYSKTTASRLPEPVFGREQF